MKKQLKKKHESTYRILGSIFLCITIFFSVLVVGKAGVENVDLKLFSYYFAPAMFFLGLFELATFSLKLGKEGKYAYLRLGYCLIDFVACIIYIASIFVSSLLLVADLIFLLGPILKRVASIIRNHSKRNIFLNCLIGTVNLLFILIAALTFGLSTIGTTGSVALAGFVLLIIALSDIVSVVFSSFNLELLKKIVKKTYAGEVLFGMLLFIISFSIVITSLEDGIKTFGDALWYCFAIVTTIGFGDYVASSFIGRILSFILGAYGIIAVSIITSIIINFYNEVKNKDDDGNEIKSATDTASEEPVALPDANNDQPCVPVPEDKSEE